MKVESVVREAREKLAARLKAELDGGDLDSPDRALFVAHLLSALTVSAPQARHARGRGRRPAGSKRK